MTYAELVAIALAILSVVFLNIAGEGGGSPEELWWAAWALRTGTALIVLGVFMVRSLLPRGVE